jgi:hypothetical protein
VVKDHLESCFAAVRTVPDDACAGRRRASHEWQ